MFKAIRRWFGRPKDTSGHVYYVRLNTPQGIFYKIGYTSKTTLTERFAYGGHGDEKLISKEFFFTFRKDAWDVEQNLLEHFHKKRAFKQKNPSMPMAGRGQTELFRYDVLGLDEALYQAQEELEKTEKSDLDKAANGCLFLLLGIILIPFTLGISLFFMFGGVADMFGIGEKNKRDSWIFRRPVHPEPVKVLIDSLAAESRCPIPAIAQAEEGLSRAAAG